MKSVKAIFAAISMGALAVLGTAGCAGPQYSQAPGEPMEQASFSDASNSDWVAHVDYVSLSGDKAWPASAEEYPLR
jgi:hypothetical protein